MKLNDLVTLERGHLSWFRYPTHNIGTYLGRGVYGGGVILMVAIVTFMIKTIGNDYVLSLYRYFKSLFLLYILR